MPIPAAPLVLLFQAAMLAIPSPPLNAPTAPTSTWTSSAEHVYGLSDIKPHKKGTLTLTTDAIMFTATSGTTIIPRSSISAVDAGNQRVEIWGVGGRVLRLVIPDGGGIAAAAVMHHRIDMLTVEYADLRGGRHDAVFFLPANQATSALNLFAQSPVAPAIVSTPPCTSRIAEPGSVFVSDPDWTRAKVPEAYKGLVYEHIVDRLRNVKGIGHVYREGERLPEGMCPQYNVGIFIASFKEGSSVKRAALGPVGMFVGTTQMVFDVSITNAAGTRNFNQQIKNTIRGEGESTNVADKVAKKLAKHYDTAVRQVAKSAPQTARIGL